MQSAAHPQCLSENDVLSLLRGTLAHGTRESAQEHIDVCTACQELFSCIAQTAEDELASGARARTTQDNLPRGSRVGRYRLVDTVGAGAMGIVYLADDPDLDRRVALKMLRRQDAQASDRLTREAQALARLSHPNVIVVYEVGSFQEHVYMAMEFVDGESLTSWLRAERSVTEILATFEQAGRGLAVAHAAGLVHRDFKPDNVLVGRDGRVRVVDFGLARGDALVRAVGDAESRPAFATPEKKDAFRTLTRTGAFMGTPAYMAPEQYEGIAADARTDQFGFCVSLYEALFASRPFEADTLVALAQAVKRGPAPPPRGSRTPRRVERAVLRGLSVRREDRFPSMDALLAELAASAAARRLGTPAALAIGVALATAASVAYVSFTRAPSAAPAPPDVASAVVAPSPSGEPKSAVSVLVSSPSASAPPAPRAPARPPTRSPPKPSAAEKPAPAGPLMPTTP